MIGFRGMGCLLVLAAAPAVARADGGADARLDGCKGLPGRIVRTDPIGEDAVHVVARSGERYLVFPQLDAGCEVYALGHPAAHAEGHFGVGARALALRSARCAGGDCPIAIAVRGKDDVPVLARRTDASCDVKLELHALKLFADRDALELVCRNSAGAGWTERHVIFDAVEDTLETLYSLNAGSYIAPTLAEKKAGECASYPVGSIRVEAVGDHPLVRVVDPAAGALQNGKGSVPARQLGYDAKRHELVPTGAPDIATDVDARKCRR